MNAVVRMPAVLAAAVVAVALLGCGHASLPPLPAGIAEIYLPRDSRTLARIAAEDDPSGALPRRREVLDEVARQLLMAPPSDPLVPELFDLLTTMAPRVEAGAISPAWASYVYTTYQRDLASERPSGTPRRSSAEVTQALDQYVEFFKLRAREGRKARTVEDWGFEDMRDYRDERRRGR